jgi:hypothetical protein
VDSGRATALILYTLSLVSNDILRSACNCALCAYLGPMRYAVPVRRLAVDNEEFYYWLKDLSDGTAYLEYDLWQ